jgi:acylphosphatase
MKDKVPDQSCLQAVVHGRVQGVSFRYHIQRRAWDLGLSGFVRNRWDGTVEVVAEGQRRELEELLAFLRVGPPGAFVTHIDTQWPTPTNDFDHFEVRH